VHEAPGTSTTSKWFKSIRSTRSRTGVKSKPRPCRRLAEGQAQPNRLRPGNIQTQGLRSEHVRTAPYTFHGQPMSNRTEPADVASCRGMTYYHQGDILRRGRLTSMTGSDSGAQLTLLSPLNRVRKLQKHDTSMLGRDTHTFLLFTTYTC
jgi:hypothetical protein